MAPSSFPHSHHFPIVGRDNYSSLIIGEGVFIYDIPSQRIIQFLFCNDDACLVCLQLSVNIYYYLFICRLLIIFV